MSPNQIYTAFSFIGFVLCAIPFYWHLQVLHYVRASLEYGTCLFMVWAGNMINRAPIYCDISTRIQAALNVAIPACSLCINRRLYKIATAKAAMTTYPERRRAVIQDLLIGVGLPILQIVTHTPPTFFLFNAWPVAIGTVSLFYCFPSDKHLHVLQAPTSQSWPVLPANGLSAIDILGTIPLGTYFIVANAKAGVKPWKSWADAHRNYSEVIQIPSIVWENDPDLADGLGIFRWSLVACAFIFFGFFGLRMSAPALSTCVHVNRQSYRLLDVHSPWIIPCTYGLRLTLLLQYFVIPLREERHHCHCGQNDQRQAQVEHLH
ncbi:pheromone A receptor-domain-containing protein [Russula vinacea]|nr:pheromone A receptor-domain-containing protein [Russula vinacea]